MIKIENYLNADKKIKCLPTKKEKRLAVLKYLASGFESGVYYTEKQVNQIITEMHSFNDYFLLRRELVESGLMGRTRDCSRYWKEETQE